MIITELNGGIGNQLFQYAIGKQLAERHKVKLMLDTTWQGTQNPHPVFPFASIDPAVGIAPKHLTRSFSTPANRWVRLARRLVKPVSDHGITFMPERQFYQLNKPACHAPDNCYLTGYWQHPGYFSDIAVSLRQALQNRLYTSLPSGYKTDSETVCLHVRRGDYVLNPRYHTLPPDYYPRSLQVLTERIGSFRLFVFSDDPAWCRQNLVLPEPVRFCEPAPAIVHLAQMSCCQHFIIPNSTFGWWASWLGRHTDSITIAPRYWLRHNGRLLEAHGLTQHSLTIP